jgi:hypothetical protein
MSKKNNTTYAVQRARILNVLIERGAKGLTTIEMREELDVMSPASRVLELRELGHQIQTVWTVSENAQGNNHRNARYVLINTTEGVAA